MGYADDLIRLRKRVVDALSLGVVDDNSKDLYEATLIQVMNEAEKQRQVCVARAEDMRRQAAVADGQSHAFSQMSSIVYSVINGFVGAAERQKREEQEFAAEAVEKQAAIDAATQSEVVETTDSSVGAVTETLGAEELNKRRRK
jgi:hypothetical protein